MWKISNWNFERLLSILVSARLAIWKVFPSLIQLNSESLHPCSISSQVMIKDLTWYRFEPHICVFGNVGSTDAVRPPRRLWQAAGAHRNVSRSQVGTACSASLTETPVCVPHILTPRTFVADRYMARRADTAPTFRSCLLQSLDSVFINPLKPKLV
jgi:hypothetical protein